MGDGAWAGGERRDDEAATDLRHARLGTAIALPDAGLDPATDRAVHESLRPLFEELSRDVLMCLRYYGVTFKGQRPQRLILTGAHAGEPGLGNSLAQRCEMSVESDDEQGTLQSLEQRLSQARCRAGGPTSGWSIPAGLSIRTLAARHSRRESGNLERAA